jgi:hypothetical protein
MAASFFVAFWHLATFRCIATPVTLLEQQRTSDGRGAELLGR